MKEVTLYMKDNCPLCDEAKALLLDLQEKQPFVLKEIDIHSDEAVLEKYQLMIPVVEVDGEITDYGQINLFKVHEKII